MPRLRRVAPILALLILLGVFATYVAACGDDAEQVGVPDVVGKTVDVGIVELQDAGFKVTLTRVPSENVTLGEIVSTDPEPGTDADDGATVQVGVSTGLGAAEVPSVIGQTKADAESTLIDAGLFADSSTKPVYAEPGTVLQQSPAVGSVVQKGTIIHIVIGEPPVQGTVPGVVGKSVAQATDDIQTAGFQVTIVGTASGKPIGQVIAQDPAADTQEAQSSVVEIKVSKGAASIAVPNVVGNNANTALATVSKAGLEPQVKLVFSDKKQGQVVAQAPAAGKQEAPGATVTLNVSQGSGSVTAPNVVGTSKAAAQGVLNGLGLKGNFVNVPGYPPSGNAVAQNPAQGTTMKVGDTMRVNISDGTKKETVTVPGLVGQPQGTAVNELKEIGLKANVFTIPSEEQYGVVVQQDPKGGAKVQQGTSVRLNVSGGPNPS